MYADDITPSKDVERAAYMSHARDTHLLTTSRLSHLQFFVHPSRRISHGVCIKCGRPNHQDIKARQAVFPPCRIFPYEESVCCCVYANLWREPHVDLATMVSCVRMYRKGASQLLLSPETKSSERVGECVEQCLEVISRVS